MSKQIIECVPNFSEGRDMNVIQQITDVIESVEGVKLLDVDPGAATNRTVVTFVGAPEPVVEAAFLAIKKAAEVIDMSKHKGEHPRMGATDVCPLIPISNISMEEVAEWAHRLGEKAGKELDIPFYMYESAATKPAWKNLATVRSGEYEALPKKMADPAWKPDYGPAVFNAKAGATAIGARDFLVAYNVNLNTTSVRRANSVAFDVREKGRVKTEGDSVTGKVLRDENGEPLRVPGACKAVKGIGWYIEEYGVAQISMNLTNINVTPLHIAFEECCKSAERRGMRVTGSELVGLVPLKVLLDAGKYFLKKQERSTGVSEAELIKIAVKTLGLDELGPFDPQQKIVEYQLREKGSAPLIEMDLRGFADETASESMAPGGGSIAAYVGALGASLGTMVANLSSHKRGWDDRWEEFSNWAEKGQKIKDTLLQMVDEDTASFNGIINAMRMPKSNEEEKAARQEAIQAATKYAIEVPFKVMELAFGSFELIKAMASIGNPNSVTDAAVGGLCARAAIRGAYLNVRINSGDLKDKVFVKEILEKGQKIMESAEISEKELMEMVEQKMP
ncbi:MAG: glutamate formimidoyltransferase [Saprospiraceae bacterium]|nr:glutamate formimidoyltransferase [Saprospiraceae bacterium]MCB9325298.1 glutamate formimidoyltransferase [Lewinellaceae bacterium]